MRAWIAAGVLFFVYVAVVSLLLRGLTRRRRWLAIGGAAAGLLLGATAHMTPHHAVAHGWILPTAILLVAYWTSGLLFVAPMPRAERSLDAIDVALRIDGVAAATPRWLAELLEVAYVCVYPLIPIALLIHMASGSDPNPDRFWTVILVTDFICFGSLPWVQTRPPRALAARGEGLASHRDGRGASRARRDDRAYREYLREEPRSPRGCIARRMQPDFHHGLLGPGDPWMATVRRLNLMLLGKSSIQVNTFPSGHAAEALAAVLLVADASWPVVVAMGISAVLVSAGAVLGRYHYAADAAAGWAVALVVWAFVFW